MFPRLLSAGLLPAALLLAGCGADVEPTASLGAALVGGTRSGPEDDAVVYLRNPQAGCSAVLLAPNLVVTTAHCTSLTGLPATFSCTERGELENKGDGAGEIGDPYEPELLEIRTGTNGYHAEPAAFGRQVIHTGTTTLCHNDLAFVVLDRNLDGLPLLPIRLDDTVRVGERFRVVGYGVNLEPDDPRERRQREGIQVVDIGVPPRTFRTDLGLCQGDSGGPALASASGAVLGVLSMLHGSCGSEVSGSTYTQLAPFREFVLHAFDVASAKPWLEGTAAPGEDPRTDESAGSGCSLSARGSDNVLAQLLLLFGLTCLRRITAAQRRRRSLFSKR